MIDIEEKSLIYKNTLSKVSDLGDFTQEGALETDFKNGKLRVRSGEIGNLRSILWGPHKKLPNNFIITWEFSPLSEEGLCLALHNASGLAGQDVFDPKLKKRVGTYSDLVLGDIRNYEFAYYRFRRDHNPENPKKSPIISDTNMRVIKNPLKAMADKKIMGRCKTPIFSFGACVGKTWELGIKKTGTNFCYWVNGKEVFAFEDPSPYENGRFAFFQMPNTVAEYSQFKIWSIG